MVLQSDETRADLTARLLEAAGGPADVVIDPVFGEPAAAAAMALGTWGRLVNIGGAAHDVAEFSSAVLRGRTIGILGYTNNAITAEQRAEALTNVLTLAEQEGASVDHRVLPLAECDRAWAAARKSGPRIVIAPAGAMSNGECGDNQPGALAADRLRWRYPAVSRLWHSWRMRDSERNASP